MRLNALFGLAFATAPPHGLTSPHTTNSQAHSSKGTPSPPKRKLRRIVGNRFQALFHSPPGVLFTFPSRYLSAIGHQEVFRLDGWSRQIHTEFQGFRATRDNNHEGLPYTYTGITHSARPSQTLRLQQTFITRSSTRRIDTTAPTTPSMQRPPALTHTRFSLLRFRSPLLTESQLFSLPVGTEMFHFPTFPPTPLYIQGGVAGHDSGTSRFPHSDIHGSTLVYQLPMAYRRLQRPSSALDAKASTDCP